jgi:hypothetical protein
MIALKRFVAFAAISGVVWAWASIDASPAQPPTAARRRGRLVNPQIGVVVDFLDPAAARTYDQHRWRGKNRGGGRNRGRGRRRGGLGGPPVIEEDMTHLDGHFEWIGGVWPDATPGDGVVDPSLAFSIDTYGFPNGAEDALYAAFQAWEVVTAGELFAEFEWTYYDDAAGVFGDGINTVSMWDLGAGILAATFILWDDADDNGAIDVGETFLEMDMIHNAQIAWGTDEFRPRGGGRTQNWYDLQAVTAHEVGHVIGLDHPGDAHRRDFYQTMYATADVRETMKRTHEADGDVSGAQSAFLGYGAP